jgi:3-hydroxyacyl-CoA dehydrogenase
MTSRVLEEGIVQHAAAIEIIFITGYGFPAYRFGPMGAADGVGLRTFTRSIGDTNFVNA